MAGDGYKQFTEYSRAMQYRLMRNYTEISSDDEMNDDDGVSMRNEAVTESSERDSEQDVFENIDDSDRDALNHPQSPVLSQSEQEENIRMDTDSSDRSNNSHSDTESDEERASDIQTDDEDNNGEDNGNNVNGELLYEGAPITTSESSLATLNLSVRPHLNGEQLTDILRLIALHCPDGNHCIKTLYLFKKHFSQIEMPLIRHYLCPECFGRVEAPTSICEVCGIEAPSNSYFLEAPIIQQIQSLYKRPGFHELLQHRFTVPRENLESFEDIYDGAVYKDLSQPGGFLHDHNNISLTWYADGIRIYHSSKYNIWVVYFVTNELPFDQRTRKENVLLVAIWFGDSKPLTNIFLEPLQTSIEQLRRGINVHIPNRVEPLNVKAMVICGTCDLQAKALFLNMKQYNGRFGCQKCKKMGLFLNEYNVRVYPYEAFNLRTDEETRVHARYAVRDRTSVCGVKGPSVLSKLVHQSIRGTAVDVMHCVFEGVVKRLMELWLSQKYVGDRWSLYEHIDIIDKRFTSLTPPSSNQRLPRSLKEHLPYLKAHEVKSWFFNTSIPCLNDVMDDDYFNHYKLLVLGISILCQSSIHPDSLVIASRALNEFVSRFEYLYGLQNMSNNVHQLRHLVENVKQFGPLWTTSCFPFEDLNGTLKHLVHGSKAAHLQICSAVSMYLNLTTLKSEQLVEGRPATSFCESLDYRRGRVRRLQISDSVYIVGKCKPLPHLPADIRQIFYQADIQGTKYSYFQKLLKKKVMFTSTEYARYIRTNSTYAAYSSHDGSCQIGHVRCFIRVADCVCPRLCQCPTRHYAILKRCICKREFSTCIDNTSLSKIHTILNIENIELAVDIGNLRSVCYCCYIENNRENGDPNRLRSQTYIIESVNLLEFE